MNTLALGTAFIIHKKGLMDVTRRLFDVESFTSFSQMYVPVKNFSAILRSFKF